MEKGLVSVRMLWERFSGTAHASGAKSVREFTQRASKAKWTGSGPLFSTGSLPQLLLGSNSYHPKPISPSICPPKPSQIVKAVRVTPAIDHITTRNRPSDSSRS